MYRTATAEPSLRTASVLALAACGSSHDRRTAPGGRDPISRRRRSPWPAAVGAGEGQVNVIAWAGYAEDGSNDPTVDWVHPFEKATGCKVNVKVANTSDEMVTLMQTGQYDVVSASGDATLRLIYAGDVAPVNTALVPNYSTIFPFLKDRDWNSVEVNGKRQMYGIPHGWGANLLMWNTKDVNPAPDVVGRGVRRQLAVQGQGHGVRLADLHRRRRALPDEDQARAGHQEPVRPGPEAVRRRGGPAQDAARR